MHSLPPGAFASVRPLFAGMDHHLAIRAVIAGTIPGAVYVDDIKYPRSALVCSRHRFHLGGDPQRSGLPRALDRLFAEVIYPEAQARDEAAYTIYYPATSGWEETVQSILAGRHLMRTQRHYYELQLFERGGAVPQLPGFSLLQVDEDLLQQEALANRQRLLAEIESEGGTVADFLAHRFGTALLDGKTIAGWCLSEFNWQDRCEVGIETLEGYRRQGIATATAGALIEQASVRGITRIGWHCAADNAPSVATAQRSGFRLVEEYPARFAFFDRAINLAVNGNRSMAREAYEDALAFYERALAGDHAEPPVWIVWNAACAAARFGRQEAALDHLQRALDLGFDDVERLRTSPHLETLHGMPEWRSLMDRLKRSV